MTFHIGLTIVASLVFLSMVSLAKGDTPLLPAPNVKPMNIVDDYFGTKVADPYRALEDESLPETQAFIAAQNARTHAFLDSPVRDQLKQRITELQDFPKQSVPVRRGKFVFFFSNTGLQNQSVLRVSEKVGDAGRLLIDPNRLSEAGVVSIDMPSHTNDGRLMAYGLATGGSDHSEIHVMDVESGAALPDVIPPARMGNIEWKHDDSGFYYGKFPKTAEHGRDEQAYHYQLFFHRLGTDPAADPLVYERKEDREMSFGIAVPEDGQYEFMDLNHGTKRENRLYCRKAGSGSEWTKLIDNEEAAYQVVESDGPVVYLLTTNAAPRGRLIAIDINKPELGNWKEIIPQGNDVIGHVELVGEKFVVTTMHDAHDLLKIYNKDGTFDRDVPLPTIGSVGPVSGQRGDSSFFYSFTSYSYPGTVFEYDLKSHTSTVVFSPPMKFNAADYETVQLFAISKDGTRVPMFVTHKKGLTLDGSHPCILSGYGGFGISTTPNFSAARIAWMERGGIYAAACMRGGGEYGEAWHQAGMLDKKQNVFDDFASAAELLVAQKYTSNKLLAIQGGSNGGLLVAACMLERPELYGAVICQVPVADMLRFNKLGIGRFWTVEYGDANASTEQFNTLRAYSPLHNVKPGQTYPPTLITTGEGDNRVVPGHSYKFAATLQANTANPNPTLLRIESKAGHGGGKPISKSIDETADIFAFLVKVMEPAR